MENKENKKDNLENPNPYSDDDIKEMSYWQLWGLRRKAGMYYFLFLIFVYSFITYLFLKVIYIFASKNFTSFSVDWWAILICALISISYWLIHEKYYHLVYLKKHPDKAIKEGK